VVADLVRAYDDFHQSRGGLGAGPESCLTTVDGVRGHRGAGRQRSSARHGRSWNVAGAVHGLETAAFGVIPTT
jgi:hypothetical protein